MQIQKTITTALTISHIDYSPSGDVVLIYCTVGKSFLACPGEENPEAGLPSFARNEETIFKSGQFMLLTVEIGGKVIKRSYSIATTPQLLQEHGLIGFSIKRVEGGIFSTRATQVAKPGDILTMTGPLGKMIDHGDCDHYLLISAGSGLSPIYSLYQSLLLSGRLIRIANIFGERKFDHILSCVHCDWVENIGSLYFLSGLSNIKAFSFKPLVFGGSIYSQCFLSQDEHEGYYLGRVQLGLTNAIDRLATTDIRVFICGAPMMVDEVRNLLVAEYGIDPAHIHFEKY